MKQETKDRIHNVIVWIALIGLIVVEAVSCAGY